MAKYFATEAAQENALDAMRIHGGYGYSPEFRPERYYRDAPLLLIGEGSNEIQQLVIARRLLERADRLNARRRRLKALSDCLESPRSHASPDEDDPGAAIGVRPGFEVHRRVDDVLDAVQHHGPGPPTLSRPFTRRTSSPLAWSSIVSQTPNAVQSISSSRNSANARTPSWSAWAELRRSEALAGPVGGRAKSRVWVDVAVLCLDDLRRRVEPRRAPARRTPAPRGRSSSRRACRRQPPA